jgi:Protein of unknown function (DUF1203)
LERFRILFPPSQYVVRHNVKLPGEKSRKRRQCDIAVSKIGEAEPFLIADTKRVSRIELILVNYEHHAVASPYRMRFAIYVRAGEERFDAVDTVPEQLRKRTLAVRGFDAGGMMTGWELIEGVKLEEAIERQFADPRTSYLHVHFAAPGCFAARVERA